MGTYISARIYKSGPGWYHGKVKMAEYGGVAEWARCG